MSVTIVLDDSEKSVVLRALRRQRRQSVRAIERDNFTPEPGQTDKQKSMVETIDRLFDRLSGGYVDDVEGEAIVTRKRA